MLSRASGRSFYCFNAQFVWKFGGKHIQTQTRRVFSHHNETELSTQSCEPIADGEVVEVMQDGEEVAETIPIGQQVVKSKSEFTSI